MRLHRKQYFVRFAEKFLIFFSSDYFVLFTGWQRSRLLNSRKLSRFSIRTAMVGRISRFSKAVDLSYKKVLKLIVLIMGGRYYHN